MYKIDFNKPIHIHFIGIGGISMSGLAEILLEEGFTVSGSDAKESPLTKKLEEMGAHIFYGQKASNIIDGIDCVVYTAAIRRDNAELIEAVAKKIPMLTRAELLGQLMKNYDTPIAVSGTHGKTTTTSMISHVLLEGDLDPTISVGGILKAIGCSKRDILLEFLAEAAAISLIGGVLGIVASLLVTPVAQYLGVRVELTPAAFLIALLFALITGTLFGFYPAYKASKLVPVEALGAE